MKEEEFEDDFGEMHDEFNLEGRKNAAQEFITGCYDAYEILQTSGKNALSEAGEAPIKNAINRMAALFIMREEYEKCSFLKKFVSENIPGFEIKPDEVLQKEIQYFI